MLNITGVTHFTSFKGTHLFGFYKHIYTIYTGNTIPASMIAKHTKSFNSKFTNHWATWRVTSKKIKKGLFLYCFHVNPLGLAELREYGMLDNVCKSMTHYHKWLQTLYKSGIAVDDDVVSEKVLFEAIIHSRDIKEKTGEQELFEAFDNVK